MKKDDHLSVMSLIEGTTVLTNQIIDANKQIEELKAKIHLKDKRIVELEWLVSKLELQMAF